MLRYSRNRFHSPARGKPHSYTDVTTSMSSMAPSVDACSQGLTPEKLCEHGSAHAEQTGGLAKTGDCFVGSGGKHRGCPKKFALVKPAQVKPLTHPIDGR